MSALTVTISWPYFFELQAYDFSEFGETMGPIHEGVLMTSSLIATIGFMISTIHAVLTMCMAGELTGNVETVYFGDRMGIANLGSFYLWIGSIILFGGTLFYHFAVFAPNNFTLLVGGGIALVMVIIWVWIPIKQQKVVYDTKYLSYNTAPRKLTIKEVDAYAYKFCTVIGVEYMSADNLKRFIELSLPVDSNTVNAPTQLATGTVFVIEKVATKILEHYADTEVTDSQAEEIVKKFVRTGASTMPSAMPSAMPSPRAATENI